MTFNAAQDAWTVYTSSSSSSSSSVGSTLVESTLVVQHPLNDPALSWNELQRAHGTWGMAVVEVYAVAAPAAQLPQVGWETTGLTREAENSNSNSSDMSSEVSISMEVSAPAPPLQAPDWEPRSNGNCNATCHGGYRIWALRGSGACTSRFSIPPLFYFPLSLSLSALSLSLYAGVGGPVRPLSPLFTQEATTSH